MRRVDCETREAALNTISFFYDLNIWRIESFFKTLNIKEILLEDINYEAEDETFSDYPYYIRKIRKDFENTFGLPKFEPHEICWFHLTRTLEGTSFSQGILPRNKAIELVWNNLLTIFRNTEHYHKLILLKEDIPNNHKYSNMRLSESEQGPFAMLVKDISFQASKVGNHDYLKIPEIMEDICDSYFNRFKFRLHETIISSLKPCIVKFTSRNEFDKNIFTPIIFYLYLTCKKRDFRDECIDDFMYANTCFDGRGKLVPAENIIEIEFL